MILQRVRNFFGKWLSPQQDDARLRSSFQEHYKLFRSLLTANNNALELIAEMEQAFSSGRPFSMTFVHSHCTALSFQVYKMIQRLQELSDGRYGGLIPAFKAISDQMETILAARPVIAGGPFILEMNEIDRRSADQVGEKMANLGEIANRAGLPVPDGFVITAAAAHHFLTENDLQDEINRRMTICNLDNLEELYRTSAAIHTLITKAPLPDDLGRQIHDAYQRLRGRAGEEQPVLAMRSSALGEDSGNASFAGQYRTQLNVDEEMMDQTYKEILAGMYKSQAIVYRLQRGFRHQDVIMCVGCLAMVDAKVGGVMYSRSPTDPRSPSVVISAAPGLAGQVVDGRVDTDIYEVSREPPHAIMALKLRRGADQEVLSDDQARELCRIAVRLEDHFGSPQDIEWSINQQDAIVLLQSRPLGESSTVESIALATGGEKGEDVLLSGGVAACRGVAAGPVYIVRSSLDLLQFPKEAVLVVEHPLPEWATLLPRAAAVISETGQVAAHLATVSREFGIPALFGVPGAVEKLKNGQVVTVDATAGRVIDGRREDLLGEPPPPPNLMKGSPIYRMLEQVLELAAPLNLTDPASIYFRPSSCKTFHDLTRFCHEKGVAEMFAFGSKYRFDEKAAKQLVGETPFQWWVIDLDDGFSREYDRHQKFVHIDQIVSVPMLAIWSGMIAVPWQGPPPVSFRGFGSIIFQSTMNRELDPAVRSGMSNRNYFLVSSNFCNLSVRLGYHFSLVESHVSDMLTENYVSFQFKGGAADEGRRFIRVQLLKDILERYDFRVEQKVDALSARIEKKPAPFLLSRLKILGYLLIHTRQIDMVMDEQFRVEQYRKKILADIEAILKPDEPPAAEN
ncbi:MAG: PEP/pyruvate-binding domain-containing protein [Desulfobulbaceae bacterium]|jgi:pyruvate,water dikinase|nr:PEP/pyruvate-binding domain-containing protein [Desulfobulbaceae bacterium]